MALLTKVTKTNATTTPLQAHLASIGACSEAREWAGAKTAREVWETCERAKWLLWWVARTKINSKSDIVKCAAKIARTVAHINTDPRVMAAIEAAEAWADNPGSDAARARARARAAAVPPAWRRTAAGISATPSLPEPPEVRLGRQAEAEVLPRVLPRSPPTRSRRNPPRPNRRPRISPRSWPCSRRGASRGWCIT